METSFLMPADVVAGEETGAVSVPQVPLAINERFATTIRDLCDRIQRDYAHDETRLKLALHVLADRVPLFLQRQVCALYERQESQQQRSACVDNIIQRHCSRYLYNPDLNGFYAIAANRIKRVPSDVIVLRLKDHLPPTLAAQQGAMLRSMKNHIMREQQLLRWDPTPAIRDVITRAVNQFFSSEDEAQYFMSLVGAIANRAEDTLTEGAPAAALEDAGGGDGAIAKVVQTAPIHLWHGTRALQAASMVNTILRKCLGHSSPFWGRLRCHTKTRRQQIFRGDFRRFWWLHFANRRRQRSQKIICNNPESFLAVCSAAYRGKRPSEWKNHATIRRTRNIINSDALFARYMKHNHDDEVAYFLPEEITDDVREYLKENNYPKDVISKRAMHHCINTQFERFVIGTRSLYRGHLRAECQHSAFGRFSSDRLRVAEPSPVPPTDGGEVATPPPASVFTPLKTDALYAAFVTWCKERSETACTMPLFEMFLHTQFACVDEAPGASTAQGTSSASSKKKGWKIRLRELSDGEADGLSLWNC